MLFRFARRMLGGVGDAEDVVQECFLFLVESPRRYRRERGELRGFLLGVLRNRMRERWRRAGREEELREDVAAPVGFDPLAGERRLAVEKAVAALPPLQREALVLAEYEELTNEEIAVVVGAEVAAVKSRLHRARANLRALLAPLLAGEPVKKERNDER